MYCLFSALCVCRRVSWLLVAELAGYVAIVVPWMQGRERKKEEKKLCVKSLWVSSPSSPHKREAPDRPFNNFRASQPVDRCYELGQVCQSTDSQTLTLWKGRSGNVDENVLLVKLRAGHKNFKTHKTGWPGLLRANSLVWELNRSDHLCIGDFPIQLS